MLGAIGISCNMDKELNFGKWKQRENIFYLKCDTYFQLLLYELIRNYYSRENSIFLTGTCFLDYLLMSKLKELIETES